MVLLLNPIVENIVLAIQTCLRREEQVFDVPNGPKPESFKDHGLLTESNMWDNSLAELLRKLNGMADNLSSLLFAPWAEATDQMTATFLRTVDAVGDQLYEYLDGQRPAYTPPNPPKQIFVKKTSTAPSKFNKGYQGISRYLAAARTRTLPIQQSNFWLPANRPNLLAVPKTFQDFLELSAIQIYDLALLLWGTRASPQGLSGAKSFANEFDYHHEYCRLVRDETSLIFNVPMEFLGICLMQHGLTPTESLLSSPTAKAPGLPRPGSQSGTLPGAVGERKRFDWSKARFGGGGLDHARELLLHSLQAISGAAGQSSEFPYTLIAMAMIHEYSALMEMHERLGRLQQVSITDLPMAGIKRHGMVASLIALIRRTDNSGLCKALIVELDEWKRLAEGRLIWPELDRTAELCRRKGVETGSASTSPRVLCPVTQLLPITELAKGRSGCIPPSFVCGSTPLFCEIAKSAIFFSVTDGDHCNLANRLLPHIRNWNIVAGGNRKMRNWLQHLYGDIAHTPDIFGLLPKLRIGADTSGPFLPPLQWDTVARHSAVYSDADLPSIKLLTSAKDHFSPEPLLTSELSIKKIVVTYKQSYGGGLLHVCFRDVCLNWYMLNGQI
ncbi:hypothetical protein GNI_014630 [Gregarina niphandrodes]|uniref:Uncharacterized protein n=1 Tax=Gregarina niphandrodes TaxID=110365 RepID=A0A023BCB2_GRENI|nr:hypothetical protein GNI_014630 [Gregarina niphandrodes]EZG83573.1 hypothetical protein GNI_014630 [Gregarina niphandrodes]|eukprot:XP_011128934.1 hypothetical protein GNI_014630 [Gregarina niphandrodes]